MVEHLIENFNEQPQTVQYYLCRLAKRNTNSIVKYKNEFFELPHVVSLHYFCSSPNCKETNAIHIYRYDFINTFLLGTKPECSACKQLMYLKHIGSSIFSQTINIKENNEPQKTLDEWF